MSGNVRRIWKDEAGAVAPTIALSLIGLIAVGGIAFDYAHLEALHTEVQDAADQAALAAATQLDGQSGACARAAAAAASMLSNKALFASGGMPAISVTPGTLCDGNNSGNVKFYQSYNQTTDSPGAAATSDANAAVVFVQVDAKTANFALTPIVSVLSTGNINGAAVASVGHAICKTPPVMICNPAEPSTNTDPGLGFVPSPGVGLNLVTGDATTPGNFGWLQSNNGPGAQNLGEELGYNSPPGDCQPSTGVTTQTGMDASVLNAFNTRFDVYSNGSTPCPGSGTCSPSDNTRKDLVCGTSGSKPSACKSPASGNVSWSEASKPYRLAVTTCKGNPCTPATDLPGTPGTDPTIMGYPPDECHMSPSSGACGVIGDGGWDRNAYFRVNYGWTSSQWTTATGLTNKATRYQVYQWERANTKKNGQGISVPQQDSGNNYAFGQPATGKPGVSQSSSQADRRVMAVAVLNCHALGVQGKTTNVPVATWMDVFLVQPALKRGSGNNVLFSDKNIYVEMIGVTQQQTDVTAQVVRRDKPYLIK